MNIAEELEGKSMESTSSVIGGNKGDENYYRRIVMDVDGVLCAEKCSKTAYSELKPNFEVIERLHEYKKSGFYIIIYSSRQMRTFNTYQWFVDAPGESIY